MTEPPPSPPSAPAPDPPVEGTLEDKGVLSFTANRRAGVLVALAAACLAAAIGCAYAAWGPNIRLLSPWWTLLPLAAGAFLLLLAWDAGRHPFLLLDGEGLIERPFTDGSRKTAWAHVDSFEREGALLVLQTTDPLAKAGETVERRVDLRSLRPPQRDLLVRAAEAQIDLAREDE